MNTNTWLSSLTNCTYCNRVYAGFYLQILELSPHSKTLLPDQVILQIPTKCKNFYNTSIWTRSGFNLNLVFSFTAAIIWPPMDFFKSHSGGFCPPLLSNSHRFEPCIFFNSFLAWKRHFSLSPKYQNFQRLRKPCVVWYAHTYQTNKTEGTH